METTKKKPTKNHPLAAFHTPPHGLQLKRHSLGIHLSVSSEYATFISYNLLLMHFSRKALYEVFEMIRLAVPLD